jgi:hypothetical protein
MTAAGRRLCADAIGSAAATWRTQDVQDLVDDDYANSFARK